MISSMEVSPPDDSGKRPFYGEPLEDSIWNGCPTGFIEANLDNILPPDSPRNIEHVCVKVLLTPDGNPTGEYIIRAYAPQDHIIRVTEACRMLLGNIPGADVSGCEFQFGAFKSINTGSQSLYYAGEAENGDTYIEFEAIKNPFDPSRIMVGIDMGSYGFFGRPEDLPEHISYKFQDIIRIFNSSDYVMLKEQFLEMDYFHAIESRPVSRETVEYMTDANLTGATGIGIILLFVSVSFALSLGVPAAGRYFKGFIPKGKSKE